MTNIPVANIERKILADLETTLEAATCYEVTGTLSPDVAGHYDQSGTYNSQNSYTKTTGDWFIWYDLDNTRWVISAVQGTAGANYWTRASVTGAYTKQGDASGTATVASGASIFAGVELAWDRKEVTDKHYTDSPIACILYEDIECFTITDLRRGADVGVVLILAVKGVTHAAALIEIQRLRAAAVNAIETSPPSDCEDFCIEEELHLRLAWGAPSLDVNEKSPWATCLVPLTIAYVISSRTSH